MDTDIAWKKSCFILSERSNSHKIDNLSIAFHNFTWCMMTSLNGGAHGVMVIVAGYGHGDTSSNPGPDWLHFT